MLKKIRNSFLSVTDTYQGIRTIVEIVALVMIIGLAITEWFKGITTTQLVLILILLFCILVIVITYILNWIRKSDISKIPDIIRELDDLARNYANEYKPIDDQALVSLVSDLMELFISVNKSETTSILESGDMTRIDKHIANLVPKLTKETKKWSVGDMIRWIVSIDGLLKERGLGVEGLKKEPRYQEAYARLNAIRERIQNAKVQTKINNYFMWSEGLYGLLAIMSYFRLGDEIDGDPLPAVIRGNIQMMPQSIQMIIDQLITDIAESIDKNTR